jgi:subtilase-type serine protease
MNPLALLLMGAFASSQALAIQTYEGDPGRLGDPASWRTAEFLRDWGLRAIGAEFAYARGFSGDGVKVGAVDSGYFAAHPQFTPSRYTGVTVSGVAGAYNQTYNDTHGTHVTGTIGAARDGSVGGTSNFHGVAFNASLYVGNTGKTDGVLYGIPQASQTTAQTIDNAYVADVYRGVNATGVRVLGTSFGSQPNTEQYQTLLPTTGSGLTGRAGLYGAWGYLAGVTGVSTWFQGALDAARTGTILTFSAGNGGYANPSPRGAAAYFDPTLEKNWLAVSAISQTGQTLNADGSINVPGTQLYNQCGVAKWSCMTAPGNAINSSTVTVTGGVPTATYASQSGTSMAQPHAAGALAVLMERFSYMSNEQVLDVMKTTGVQNATISNASGTAVANPNAGKIVVVPDSRNGWGTVSLRNAMNGPGQFTGKFAVNTQGQDDTWSNNISDTAIRARKAEDDTEAAAWAARKIEKGWQAGLPPGASTDETVEYTTGVAREAARGTRLYVGGLSKAGPGTLTLSGSNSYTGGTELLGGALVAASATALGSGNVSVLDGVLATRSASTVIIGGDLTLGGLGTLDLGFGFGAPGALLTISEAGSLLSVTGRATLGGTLTLSFAEGAAAVGLYDLFDYGSFDGSFTGVNFSGVAAGFEANLVFGPDGIDLNITAVPEPGTYALMFGGLGLVAWLARRRRPQTLAG